MWEPETGSKYYVELDSIDINETDILFAISKLKLIYLIYGKQ